ncbi:MAG: hypothetical protein KI792_07640 [Alphaproteobacteria bacterium]|nr:hypothetical protein [Alphaproteobacteria bacterium SS10]
MSNLGPEDGEQPEATGAAPNDPDARVAQELEQARIAAAEEDAIVPDADAAEQASPETPIASIAADDTDPDASSANQVEAEFTEGPAPKKNAAQDGQPQEPVFDDPSLEDKVTRVRQSEPDNDDASVKAQYYRESKKFLDIKRKEPGQGIQLADEDAELVDSVRPVDPDSPRLSMNLKRGGSVEIGNKTARANGLHTHEERDLAAAQIVANAQEQGMARIRIKGSDPEAKARLYYHARAAGLGTVGFVPPVPAKERRAEIDGIRAKMARDRDFYYDRKEEVQLGAEMEPGVDPKPGPDDEPPGIAPGGDDGGPKPGDGGGTGLAKRLDVAALTAGAASAPGGLLEAMQETMRGDSTEKAGPAEVDLGINQMQQTQIDAAAISMANAKLDIEAMPLGTPKAFEDAGRARFEQAMPGIGANVHDHLFGTPNADTGAAFKDMLGQAGVDVETANIDGIAERMRGTAQRHMEDERSFANGAAPDAAEPKPAEPAPIVAGLIGETAQPKPTTAALVDALNPSTGNGVDAKRAIEVVATDPKVRGAVNRAVAALPLIVDGAAEAAKTNGVKGAIVAAGKGVVEAAAGGEDGLHAGALAKVHENRAQAVIGAPTPGDVIALPGPTDSKPGRDRPALT